MFKKRVLPVLLSLVMVLSAVLPISIAIAQTTDATVDITVNFVYQQDDTMVSKPYIAQLKTGDPFVEDIAVPETPGYSVDDDCLAKLPKGFSFDPETDLLHANLDSVTEDINIVLYYKAGQAEYTVEHWVEQLNGEMFLDKTVKLEGDIGTYTDAQADNLPGFFADVERAEIASDGSTVVKINYHRLSYTVQFDVNGGVNGPAPIYAKYGTPFNMPEPPERAGYTFSGWEPELTAETAQVTGDITYVAQWTPISDEANYTIVIWGQNANDDNYSYLDSHPATGVPGSEVTWDESTKIREPHTHTGDCYELTCGLEEHRHTADCLICGKEEHTHSWQCYSIGWDGIKLTCGKDEHTHTASCYRDVEHTHNESCYTVICGKEECSESECNMGALYPDRDLWIYDHSDTVTIDAAGNTVLNVYFNRTEFTLTFNYDYEPGGWWESGSYQTNEQITDRWGADISDEYTAIMKRAGGALWSKEYSGDGPYTSYFGIMPVLSKESDVYGNGTFYLNEQSGRAQTMYYYFERIDSDQYDLGFQVTFYGSGNFTVTAEDRYEFEGFTFDHGTSIGSNANGARFYYTRNTYTLNFFSGDNSEPIQEYEVPYESPLSGYANTRPDADDVPPGMEDDAVFVDWYLNPECTGEPFDFSATTMPANNIALYAKWANGLYTVKTYLDDTFEALYTYDGYDGVQDNIEKYTTATAPEDPVKPGWAFVGWFYKDEAGQEQPFSFTMPITRDYNLYPKYTQDVVVNYTVHYVDRETGKKLADDYIGRAQLGTTVTEQAKVGEALIYAENELYFPETISHSIELVSSGLEYTFYYVKKDNVDYTVKYVDEETGEEIWPAKTVTTDKAIVTEIYQTIPNYTPKEYSITLGLSATEKENVITFHYYATNTTLTIEKQCDKLEDPNQTFLFQVTGMEENNKEISMTVAIKGSGSILLTDLPVGKYQVTELTNWSWRYEADDPIQEIELTSNDEENKVRFSNTLQTEQWLDGEANCQNNFDSIKEN